MDSQMVINAVIAQPMVGGSSVRSSSGSGLVKQIVQTNINLLFTCDQSCPNGLSLNQMAVTLFLYVISDQHYYLEFIIIIENLF